ncbi:MAG: glycosyltransferase [Gemmatimonadales bacterium]
MRCCPKIHSIVAGMNILWVSHFVPYPPKGGALQRSYHLLRETASRHQVHLVMIGRRAIPSHPDLLLEAEEHFRGFLASSASFQPWWGRSAARWWVLVAGTGLTPLPFDQTSLHSLAMHAHLKRLSGKASPDVVHLDTIGLWPYARYFASAPIVLNHHNIESQLTQRRAALEPNPLKRAYLGREASKLDRLERLACVRARTNIVVSELDAARLRAVAPTARAWVVDNGVDVGYFRPNPDVRARPKSLVFAGGMNWYPNRDAAVYFVNEIWPRLREVSPESSITFVGQDPAAEVTGSPDPRIRATGFVDDVRPFLDQAEIYVCPIRNGGGTRLKILDALAMAKPIVATGLAVEGLDLIDGEHYLRAEGPDEFATSIRSLQADPESRNRLSQAGRKLVEDRYSWTRIGRQLDEAYRFTADQAEAAGGAASPSFPNRTA